MSTNDLRLDRHDSQSDDMYTTPISPLSPLEKSPPPQQALPIIIALNEIEEKTNGIHEMQTFIQSSNDLTFPLEDSWTFWYFKNDRTCDWKDNLVQIATVSTVESFWSVFNRLKIASQLTQGCDYWLFKKHIVRFSLFVFLFV